MKLLILAAFLFYSSGARANFVSYVDENGTRHFVQSETEIPEKYRAKAKVSTSGNPENSHVEVSTETKTSDPMKPETSLTPEAPLTVQPTGLVPMPVPSEPPSSK
jgi:hypothetical protein